MIPLIIDDLFGAIQHIISGTASLSVFFDKDCMEFRISLARRFPVIIVQYKLRGNYKLPSDRGRFVIDEKNYKSVIDALLLMVEKVIAGIATISKSRINDVHLQFKIVFPSYNCTLRLVYDRNSSPLINDEYEKVDCSVKNHPSTSADKFKNTTSRNPSTDKFKNTTSRNPSTDKFKNTTSRNTSTDKFKNTTSRNPSTDKFKNANSSVNQGLKNSSIAVKCATVSKRVDPKASCRPDNVRSSGKFINKPEESNSTYIEIVDYTVEYLSDNCASNSSGTAAEKTLRPNVLTNAITGSYYSPSDTTVIDMEIDDEKLIPNKCQRIVFDYSKARKLFQCKYCVKRFDSLWDTNKHEKTHVCSFCQEVFLERSMRSKHEKIHMDSLKKVSAEAEEKSFTCSDCGITFSTKIGLRSHEKIHREEKHFSCNHCDKVFPSNFKKQVHEMIHTGVKPFTCTYCMKTFTTNALKKRHEQTTHMGENITIIPSIDTDMTPVKPLVTYSLMG